MVSYKHLRQSRTRDIRDTRYPSVEHHQRSDTHWAHNNFFHAEPSNCTHDDAINSTLNDAVYNKIMPPMCAARPTPTSACHSMSNKQQTQKREKRRQQQKVKSAFVRFISETVNFNCRVLHVSLSA